MDRPEGVKGGAPKGAPAVQNSPIQAVAGGLTRWFLMLSGGLGALGIVAAYMGLLVIASMLASIVFVALTLYFFLRFWPEEDAAPEAPPRRPAMVSATRVDGPPRARFVMALREVVRRQESFRISPQGAERFARVIRFMLRNQ